MYKHMSTEGKEKTIKQIEEHITKLSKVPGNIISYTDASSMIRIFGEIADHLKKQIKDAQ